MEPEGDNPVRPPCVNGTNQRRNAHRAILFYLPAQRLRRGRFQPSLTRGGLTSAIQSPRAGPPRHSQHGGGGGCGGGGGWVVVAEARGREESHLSR